VLRTDRTVEGHARAVARQRLRHAFIGGTRRSPLRIQRRIVHIGEYQRPIERIGKSREEYESSSGACDRTDRKLAHASSKAPIGHPNPALHASGNDAARFALKKRNNRCANRVLKPLSTPSNSV